MEGCTRKEGGMLSPKVNIDTSARKVNVYPAYLFT